MYENAIKSLLTNFEQIIVNAQRKKERLKVLSQALKSINISYQGKDEKEELIYKLLYIYIYLLNMNKGQERALEFLEKLYNLTITYSQGLSGIKLKAMDYLTEEFVKTLRKDLSLYFLPTEEEKLDLLEEKRRENGNGSGNTFENTTQDLIKNIKAKAQKQKQEDDFSPDDIPL